MMGMKMRSTKRLIFGSPKAGTPLMLAALGSAIDLLLKILIWEDAHGTVWVSHNSQTCSAAGTAAKYRRRRDIGGQGWGVAPNTVPARKRCSGRLLAIVPETFRAFTSFFK